MSHPEHEVHLSLSACPLANLIQGRGWMSAILLKQVEQGSRLPQAPLQIAIDSVIAHPDEGRFDGVEFLVGNANQIETVEDLILFTSMPMRCGIERLACVSACPALRR